VRRDSLTSVHEDGEQTPSSRDGAAWSVPASAALERSRRAPAWVHALGVVLVLTGPVLFTIGLSWGDRSMDLPLSGNVRPGLRGFGMPTRWVCADGHDHWSAPFWLGAVLVSLTGGGAWSLLARRLRR
jgi:drug/metabolite transporter (DMT)-like permease